MDASWKKTTVFMTTLKYLHHKPTERALEVCRLMLLSKPDLNARSATTGLTPVMHALAYDEEPLAWALLDSGLRIDPDMEVQIDTERFTIITLALHFNSSERILHKILDMRPKLTPDVLVIALRQLLFTYTYTGVTEQVILRILDLDPTINTRRCKRFVRKYTKHLPPSIVQRIRPPLLKTLINKVINKVTAHQQSHK
ncbi:hypothetical protein HK102_009820 [Quaeritorhiza haematococci]|nr:hypothetical protein HK102_009820 [Quaeritorhiza haematococci]